MIAALRSAGGPTLTPVQSMLFPQLDPDGTTQSELARRLGVSRQAVHQIVSQLASAGMLEIVEDPVSGRNKLVRLTASGRDSVDTANAAFARLEEQLAERIGRIRIKGLRAALESDWGFSPGFS